MSAYTCMVQWKMEIEFICSFSLKRLLLNAHIFCCCTNAAMSCVLSRAYRKIYACLKSCWESLGSSVHSKFMSWPKSIYYKLTWQCMHRNRLFRCLKEANAWGSFYSNPLIYLLPSWRLILQYAMRSRIVPIVNVRLPIALHFVCPFCLRVWQYYYVEKRRWERGNKCGIFREPFLVFILESPFL